MKMWKDYTTEDAIIVTEKVMKAIRLETTHSKLCPDVVHDFTGFTTELIMVIMKEIMQTAKTGWVNGFMICILDKFKS